ncbi:hypothetical protein L1F30_07550 [Simiduia sp. 21SJ11W-1]|uniref:hypothetical protein n=1 Tax=Simiduia sp. 21SJ11W-1 TaxID=2909669 RepID=UPI0020A16577|nr:hypothetical protein [Simiduia sp. 21SJ11W-1]UTA49381.1 hypothetical protein L1F30_07550 [Simiduia sp. 21SJ11W-1]
MTSLIIFCAIAVLSLLVVSLANQRQERLRSRRIRLQKIKLRVDELETLLIHLTHLLENPDVLIQINDEIVDMYQAMIDLDSSLPYLEAGLNTAQQRASQLSTNQSLKPRRLLESDAKIALAQKHLTEAAKVIRHRQAHAKISMEEMQLFVRELSYQHLMVDVISMVGQGHKAMNKSNPLSAHAYYKKARQMLISSTHSDPRRHQMIKQVAEMLDGKRVSLSEELMPETFLNPDAPDESSDQLLDDMLDD